MLDLGLYRLGTFAKMGNYPMQKSHFFNQCVINFAEKLTCVYTLTLPCLIYSKHLLSPPSSPVALGTKLLSRQMQTLPLWSLKAGYDEHWMWQSWHNNHLCFCYHVPCLFNLYAEYIMRNAGLEETQAGIKIAGRNISNLRYADDTILRQKVKKNLRASWWKWKRRVKKLA